MRRITSVRLRLGPGRDTVPKTQALGHSSAPGTSAVFHRPGRTSPRASLPRSMPRGTGDRARGPIAFRLLVSRSDRLPIGEDTSRSHGDDDEETRCCILRPREGHRQHAGAKAWASRTPSPGWGPDGETPRLHAPALAGSEEECVVLIRRPYRPPRGVHRLPGRQRVSFQRLRLQTRSARVLRAGLDAPRHARWVLLLWAAHTKSNCAPQPLAADRRPADDKARTRAQQSREARQHRELVVERSGESRSR